MPIWRDPKRQPLFIGFVLLIAVLLYSVLLGDQGEAQDVVLGQGLAYLSVGQYGGLRLLSAANPSDLVELGSYDTAGQARKLALQNQLIFIADGNKGLRIIDVSDPANPRLVGALDTHGFVEDITVVGRYAYLANGPAGLMIVDISDPTHPAKVSSLSLPGYAQGVAVSINSSPGSELQGNYAFVACGRGGLQVIDVASPPAPVLRPSLKIQVNARKVVLNGPYAYVAAGSSGIKVIQYFGTSAPQLRGGYSRGRGEANALMVQNSTVYAAYGSGGLKVIDFHTPSSPQELVSYSLPGEAVGVGMLGQRAFVAIGKQGLRVIDLSDPQNPVQVGSYDTPGEANFGQVLLGYANFISGNWDEINTKTWSTMLVVGVDFVLFFVALLFWLVVFAQFILPVQSLGDRLRVVNRLMAYWAGNHGPAIYIQNGEIRQRENEEQRAGPGVALLDTASASILRNAHAFTRPVGPGTVFTRADEFPAGVVDLHTQAQVLGPSENEDPFEPKGPKELEEAYRERQKRRDATSALTRDGVEIVPVITAVFKLYSQPGEGHTQFGYDPRSVWAAIAREGIEVEPDGTQRVYPWNMLPARVAADLWREYLRKFTLDELFSFSSPAVSSVDGPSHKTAFDIIQEQVRLRLTQPVVEELDDVGRPTGVKHPSKEYEILKERGIQVMGVSIRSLHFPVEVEDLLVQQWKATWLQRAQGEMRQAEHLQAEERMKSQQRALQ